MAYGSETAIATRKYTLITEISNIIISYTLSKEKILNHYFKYTTEQIYHVERKVPKYENHKIWERKVKTHIRNWRDHRGTDTQKHTETV